MMDTTSTSQLTLPVGSRDHRRGPANAPVTLLEYGDYECPYCGAAFPILERVRQTLGDKLQFAFRNFPLTAVHPQAEEAAEAAESVGAQGKFWEMHDAIYEHQDDLSTAALLQLAASVGADPKITEHDLRTGKYADRVYEDFMSGVRSGVNGTPTFFINGTRYEGEWDEDTLTSVLEAAAAKQST